MICYIAGSFEPKTSLNLAITAVISQHSWVTVHSVSLIIQGFQQRAKKVVSDSPGLVDFAIRLVIFVLNLPDGQVLCCGEIQVTEEL